MSRRRSLTSRPLRVRCHTVLTTEERPLRREDDDDQHQLRSGAQRCHAATRSDWLAALGHVLAAGTYASRIGTDANRRSQYVPTGKCATIPSSQRSRALT